MGYFRHQLPPELEFYTDTSGGFARSRPFMENSKFNRRSERLRRCSRISGLACHRVGFQPPAAIEPGAKELPEAG